MERIIIEDCFDDVLDALDDALIPYDLDSYDRLMIEEEYVSEVIDILDRNGWDYDLV